METTMQQVRIVVTTINGTYYGTWEEDHDNEFTLLTDHLDEHGLKAHDKLTLDTTGAKHFFNTDHVVALSVETRPAHDQ